MCIYPLFEEGTAGARVVTVPLAAVHHPEAKSSKKFLPTMNRLFDSQPVPYTKFPSGDTPRRQGLIMVVAFDTTYISHNEWICRIRNIIDDGNRAGPKTSHVLHVAPIR